MTAGAPYRFCVFSIHSSGHMYAYGGILRILHWAFPFTVGKGGQSVFIERISLEFSSWGHSVGIITSAMDTSEVPILKLHFENLVEFFELPTAEVAFEGHSRTYGHLKNIIDGFAPEIIHIHNLESPMLVYLRSYLNMTPKRPKIIITVHDLSTLRKLKKLELSLKLSDFFDAIIFPSKFMHDTFAPCESIEKPKFVTIYNGVPQKQNVEPKNRNHPHLLFAAHLNEHKGGLFLLNAWRKLFREFPDVTLNIAGDGPVRNFLEQYAKLVSFEEQVRFCGWLTQDQLDQEFRNDCVLVIPSVVGEAFGLIGAEASMAGVPIIAHRIGALKEIIIDNSTGLLVTPGDTFELASKIRELLLNADLRRSMGEAGHNWAIENFHLTASAKSYEAFCRLLI